MKKRNLYLYGPIFLIGAGLIPASIIACSQSIQEKDDNIFNEIKNNKELVDAYLESVEDTYSTTIKDKTLQDLGWKIGDSVDPKTLGIDLPPNQKNYQFIFSVIEINDETGEVKVKISVLKGDARNDKIITIDGFQTREQKEHKQLVDAYLESVEDTYSTIHKTKTTKDQLYSRGNSTNTYFLGIDLPQNKDDLTIELTIDEVSITEGQVKVKIDVSKGEAFNSKTITVSGFKTQAKEDQELVDEYLQGIKNDYPTTLKDNTTKDLNLKEDQIVDPKILGITLPNLRNLEIELIIKKINYETGKIEVLITISKGNASNQKLIIVSGFKTKEQEENAKLVAKYFQDLQNNYSTTFKDKTLEYLGWRKGDNLNPQILGITLPNHKDLEIKLIVEDVNIYLGQIKIKISFSKGNASKSKVITITGFKTKDQEDRELVDAYIKSVQNTYSTNKKNNTTQDLNLKVDENKDVDPKILGITLPLPNHKDLEIKLIVKNISYDKGEIEALIRVFKGNGFDVKTITISGFKTKAQKYKEDQQSVENYLDKIKDEYVTTNQNASTRQFEYKTGDNIDINLQFLGVKFPQNDDGLTINPLLVTNVSHSMGMISTKITVSKGDYSNSKTFLILDFKNDKKIVEEYIQDFKDHVLVHPLRITASSDDITRLVNTDQYNKYFNQHIDPSLLGIKFPQPPFDSLTIKLHKIKWHYNTWTKKFENNRLDFKIIFTLGSASQTIDDGFAFL